MINIDYLEKIARGKWRDMIDAKTKGIIYDPNKDWKSIGLDPQSQEFMTYLGKQFKEPQVKYHAFLDKVNQPSKIDVLRTKRNGLVQDAIADKLALKGIDKQVLDTADEDIADLIFTKKELDHPVTFTNVQPPLPENAAIIQNEMKQQATEARNLSQQIGAFKNQKTPGFTEFVKSEARDIRAMQRAAEKAAQEAAKKAAQEAAKREALKKRSLLYIVKEHPKAAIGIAGGLGALGVGSYLYNQRADNSKWRNI